MKKIKSKFIGIGLLLCIFGAAALDSDNLMLPVIISCLGLFLVLIGEGIK